MSWWNKLLAAKAISEWKAPVRMATTASLAAYTRVGNVITADANGAAAAVDGVTPAIGDGILLWHGADDSDNGIYEWTSVGSGSTKWILTRRVDADGSDAGRVRAGMRVGVTEGTLYAKQVFALTTTGGIVVNTTALTFAVDSVLSTLSVLGDVTTDNGGTIQGSATVSLDGPGGDATTTYATFDLGAIHPAGIVVTAMVQAGESGAGGAGFGWKRRARCGQSTSSPAGVSWQTTQETLGADATDFDGDGFDLTITDNGAGVVQVKVSPSSAVAVVGKVYWSFATTGMT